MASMRNVASAQHAPAPARRASAPEVSAHDQDHEHRITRLCAPGGTRMLKFGKFGRPHYRNFYLTHDNTRISWKSGLFGSSAFVDLSTAQRVQRGMTTTTALKFKAQYAAQENRAFSVIYGEGRSLDVVCSKDEDFDAWFFGLDFLIRREAEAKRGDPFMAFLRAEWRAADRDGSGTLDRAEITTLVQKLNGNLSAKYIRKIFLQVDADGSNQLDFTEFQEFIKILLRREELEHLWRRVVGAPDDVETAALLSLRAQPDQLLRFLRDDQFEPDVTLESTAALIATLDRTGNPGTLGYDDFRLFMSGAPNDAFHPERQKVHHDMTQPLCHYYMAASHNTYLEGNQLNSNSSVARYIDDMVKGCRSLELDCWDGDDGEPVIYHGHTLTSKILFRDVVQAVHDFAFETSEYPLVLSLENHCGLEGQRTMARYFRDILGAAGMLPAEQPPRTFNVWPSPEQLKGKIIIKGKCAPDQAAAEGVEEEEESSEDEEAKDGEGKEGEAKPKRASVEGSPAAAAGAKTHKPKKVKVAQELSDLTMMRGVHFKGLDHPTEAYDISSLKEPKMERLMAKSPTEWVKFNQHQFTRIYPAGFRVDSSNYNPILPWAGGNQMVALNYQTPGESMQINDAKFRENGSCGYVLMPPQLRDPNTTFHPSSGPFVLPPMTLRVTVVSGQQLPKPKGEQKGEVIDPYVMVELHGLGADTQKGQRTPTVDDNGLNPQWGQAFTFNVQAPEFAFLLLTVYDEDPGRDDFIAYGCVPLPCLRAGYRALPLFNDQGKRTAEFQHASLFIRVEMEGTAATSTVAAGAGASAH